MQYRLKKNTIAAIISGVLIFTIVITMRSISDRVVKVSTSPPYAYETDLYGAKRTLQARLAHTILKWTRKPSGAQDLASYREHVQKKNRKNIYKPGKLATRFCDLEQVELNGVPVYTLTPRKSGNNRAILYFHGGAYMSGPYIQQWRMLNQVAAATGCKVYLVRYTLGTEAPFPAALNDVMMAYEALIGEYRSRELILMGDSAGGGLIFALSQKIRDAGKPQPGKLIAISPWMNLKMDHPDLGRFERQDPMLHLKDIDLAARTYAGDHDINDPLISPVNTSFDGMPPALLMIGTNDMLLPDCIVFRSRAEAAGYDLTFILANKMFHVWPGGIGYFPEAKRGIRQIADYIIHYPLPRL